MMSLLILLGLLPAGLMLIGDDDDDDADHGDEAKDSPEAKPKVQPLDIALNMGDAPVEDGPDAEVPLPAPEAEPPEDVEAGVPPDPAVDAPADPPAPPEAGETPEGEAEKPPSDDAENDQDPPEGRDFLLDPEDGDRLIEDFRPGSDVLDIEIKNEDVIAFRSLDPESGDPQLRLFDGTSEQVITFAGLSQLPLEDIFLLLTDPDTGDAISLAVADFLFNEGDALDPISPDEPSVITPADGETDGPPLHPIPADSPSVITPAPSDQTEDQLEASEQMETLAALEVVKRSANG